MTRGIYESDIEIGAVQSSRSSVFVRSSRLMFRRF